jgi:hypothetical protein
MMMISCKTPTRKSKFPLSFHTLCNQLIDDSYDFEYEDDDEEQGGDVDIENKYYNAKQMKVDNPEEAVDEFLAVPALEPEKGDWYVGYSDFSFTLTSDRGFKGLKQAIKLEFQLKRYVQVPPTNISRGFITNLPSGCRTLPRIAHIRQVCRYAKLLGEIH